MIILRSIYIYIYNTGFFKKTAILLHVVTSHLIPPRPLDQCCCPMHAGIRTEMAVFFEGLSKQSDVTTLNWGKGGMQVSSQWILQDGCFFWRTRTQSGKDFLVYGTDVQTQAWTNYLLHLPQPQSKHTLIFKAATQQTKKHKIFLVYGCANASLNKFPFARATTPIQRHVHLHSCYPQTKNVPPRLQKQNCTNCVLHSARTVHAQCTVQCTPQCTATKRCKYHGIGVLLTSYKKLYIFSCVFWLFLGTYVRAAISLFIGWFLTSPRGGRKRWVFST